MLLLLLNILFHSETHQISEVKWVANSTLCWLQTDYTVENPSSQRTNQTVRQSPAVLLTLRHFRAAPNYPRRRHQGWAMFNINLCHSTSQDLTQSKSHKLSLRGRISDKWVSIRVKSDNTRSVRSRGERQTEKWFYVTFESVTWRRRSIRLSKKYETHWRVFDWAVRVPDSVRRKEETRLWKCGWMEVLRGSEFRIFFSAVCLCLYIVCI